MRGWRAIWSIAAYELRREWFGVVATSIFAIYAGVVVSGIIGPVLRQHNTTPLINGLFDWLYLFSLPVFGCLMNRTVFTYWRDDIFTKRIAHWRTMPIPPQAIAGARLLQSVVMMIVACLIFFGSQFGLSSEIQSEYGAGVWIAEAVVWMSYGLIVNAGYGYLELGYSGKTYVKYYLGYSLLTGIGCIMASVQGMSLIVEVFKLVNKEPVLYPVIGVLLAAIVMAVMNHLTVKRIKRRRYTF